MNHNDTMPHVLQVPELLDMIVHGLDKGTLTEVVRVCKAWSNVALTHLWASQTDLRPLFNLLASKGYELKDNKLDLKELPLESDWHRFFKYSSRIKFLKVDDTDERYTHLLDTFARLRPFHLGPNGNLFPSLRTLEWIGPNETSLLSRSVLFMHPGIQTFHITLPSAYVHTRPGPALRQYIDHVVGRMPKITHLSVFMNGCMAIVVEPSVLQLVKGLSESLATLEIPRYWTSSTLLETLSTLPRFRNLQSPNRLLGIYDPARRFAPAFPTNTCAWPSLERLHLGVPYDEVIHFLNTAALPESLVELFVYTPRIEPPRTIRTLCSTIAKRCPTVRCLLIGKCTTRLLEQNVRPNLEHCPSIDDLQPLFDSLTSLTEFSFHHEFPLVFRESRVKEVAKKLQNAVYLDLNPSPDYEPASYTHGDFPSLKSLSDFGRRCRNLTELGIYVDTANEGYKTRAEPATLPRLTELLIGGPGPVSEISADDALIFLSKVLYGDCSVVSASVHRLRGVPRVVAERKDEFWRGVNERLPLVIKVRMEESKMISMLFDVVEKCEEEIRRCGGDLGMLEPLELVEDDDDDKEEEVEDGAEGHSAAPPPVYAPLRA